MRKNLTLERLWSICKQLRQINSDRGADLTNLWPGIVPGPYAIDLFLLTGAVQLHSHVLQVQLKTIPTGNLQMKQFRKFC